MQKRINKNLHVSILAQHCTKTLFAACASLACCIACLSTFGDERSPLTPLQETKIGMRDSAPSNSGSEAACLEISLGQAVVMALSNNRALAMERLSPGIRQTFEDEERAAFDPVFAGEVSAARSQDSATNTSEDNLETDRIGGFLSLSEALPTGTRLDLRASGSRADTEGVIRHSARAEIVLTQPLLRGMPPPVNLARLRQARMDTAISTWEFRGLAQDLVAGVEAAYWECVLARRRVEILETSYSLAEQQAAEIAHRIRVGDLPETEEAAARAESALRKEALINAKNSRTAAELRLMRIMAPTMFAATPRRVLVFTTAPVTPNIKQEPVSRHVLEAMQLRPDLNEARLRLERNELEVVRTRNGLLPKLDFFVQLGDSGYSDSFSEAANAIDGKGWEGMAGLSFEFPALIRAERARHRRALASREQAQEALLNMADLVQLDVEIAHLEVGHTLEQVQATAETRRLQEVKFKAESAKFAVGRSTALSVSQVQRDLVDSQLAEASALVRHLEAWVALFRADGSLLDRRGLVVESGSQDGQSREKIPADEQTDQN